MSTDGLHESAEVTAEALAESRTIPTERVVNVRAWTTQPYTRDATDVYVVRYIERTHSDKAASYRSERLELDGPEGGTRWVSYEPNVELPPFLSIPGIEVARGEIAPRDLALLRRLGKQRWPRDLHNWKAER